MIQKADNYTAGTYGSGVSGHFPRCAWNRLSRSDPLRSPYGNTPTAPPTVLSTCAYTNDGEDTSTLCTYDPATGKPVPNYNGDNDKTVCPSTAVQAKAPHCIGTKLPSA